MTKHKNPLRIPLPSGWAQRVNSAMLRFVSLAHYVTVYTCSWAVNCQIVRVRLKAENNQLRQQEALLTEEIRVKDARMKRIAAHKRPHYAPIERMSILDLRPWQQFRFYRRIAS